MEIPWIILIGLPLLAYVLGGIRVAQEYERGVIFRLGRCKGIRGPGLYWLAPIFEWQRCIDIRTTTVSVEQQETITKDSVTIKVNAVIWFRVLEPVQAVITVKDYQGAVYQVALTTLRNMIGQFALDDVLKERDAINNRLRELVDQATLKWGVVVEMVEMKDVEIPQSMQRAMAREAEAMREKRARIIKAEAELEASEKLCAAATLVEQHPAALELRRMQMISEVGAEHNTTTILMIPSDFVTLARATSEHLMTHGGPPL